MEIISKALFWVANSLLIPDIILLLLLFGRSLFLIGSFYNQFIIKRKTDQKLGNTISKLDSTSLSALVSLMPEKDSSLFVIYLRKLLSENGTENSIDYLINNFEIDAEKDLSTSKMLAKLGPILGLIGTLIAMSPALVGLSTGDISGMAYNMQVVFATTVVGLVISGIGIFTLQVKQRWYAKDVNNLDFVSQLLIDSKKMQ